MTGTPATPGSLFHRSLIEKCLGNSEAAERYASRVRSLDPTLPICQTDLPLDWYQREFKPYAEEYLASGGIPPKLGNSGRGRQTAAPTPP